jgi:hypothetical protein
MLLGVEFQKYNFMRKLIAVVKNLIYSKIQKKRRSE